MTIDLPIARYRALLWILAFFVTIFSAVYQRKTGPSYAIQGEETFLGTSVQFDLPRSQEVGSEAEVVVRTGDSAISGVIRYRRKNSDDGWTIIPMQRVGERLSARLPQQPPAGKLVYFVDIQNGSERMSLTGEKPVIIRYKGRVPVWILLPHILLMFGSMLLANRTGLEALDSCGKARCLLNWTVVLFFLGGLVFGPVMQKFAFGAFWTGFPFGTDLTDNKTLISAAGWIIALFMNRKGRDGRMWIVFAACLMLVIYFVPHSLLGSELDYQ